MANYDVTVQLITRASIMPTYSGSLTTTDTYLVPNDGKTILHFKKSGAGACTVSIPIVTTVDGQTVAVRTFSVAATTGDKMVGPFPPGTYNDGNGKLSATFSEITGLTIAALRHD